MLLLLLSTLALGACTLPQPDEMMLVQRYLKVPSAAVGDVQEDGNVTGEPVKESVPQAIPGFEIWQGALVDEVPTPPVPRRPMPECDVFPPTGTCKPNFMLIGVQKSATSTIYQILNTHPQIRAAVQKEPLWFNGNFESVRCDPPSTVPNQKDFTDYLRVFFPRLGPGSGQILGEFTVTYLHCWCCPAAFQRLMPNLRLMALLRDPIERARSRWKEQHTWWHGVKTYGTFEEYIEQELPALENCMWGAHTLEKKVHCAAQSNILGMSIYDTVLQLWFQHFQPQDFLVMYTEQLALNPRALMSAVHAHLGIEEHEYPEGLLKAHYNHEGNYGWDHTLMVSTRGRSALQRLYKFYRPHMQGLKYMADAGLISELPRTWVARWTL